LATISNVVEIRGAVRIKQEK